MWAVREVPAWLLCPERTRTGTLISVTPRFWATLRHLMVGICASCATPASVRPPPQISRTFRQRNWRAMTAAPASLIFAPAQGGRRRAQREPQGWPRKVIHRQPPSSKPTSIVLKLLSGLYISSQRTEEVQLLEIWHRPEVGEANVGDLSERRGVRVGAGSPVRVERSAAHACATPGALAEMAVAGGA